MVFALDGDRHLKLRVDGVGIKLAAMVKQGIHSLQVAAAFYLTHKNYVVPFFVATAVKALKCGYSPFNQRSSMLSRTPSYTSKAVYVFSGKLTAQMRLFGTEYIDSVMGTGTKHCHR